MNMKSESIDSLNEIGTSESKKPCIKQVVTVAMTLWAGLILLLGAKGAFTGPAGSPPLPIFFGFAIPLAFFFAAYFGWSRFRAFVLGVDLRLVAAMQAWRWAGFGFLALYAHRVLPALFAFPAGLGDMAVGITAPWIMLGLIREPSFAASRRFVIWNIMGILDLVVAVSLGTVCSGFIPGLTGNVTTSSLAQLPLVLIPAFLVPFFIMLHFTALAQTRQMESLTRLRFATTRQAR
jgi:hypothetical protein